MKGSPVLLSKDLLRIEQRELDNGLQPVELFTQAGLAAAASMRSLSRKLPLVFVILPGRKGALALATALELHQMSRQVKLRVCVLFDDDNSNSVYTHLLASIPAKLVSTELPRANEVIIDGMYGFDIPQQQSQNETMQIFADLHNPRIAIEMPSGVEADTGRVGSIALHCAHTFIFVAPMVCHVMMPSRHLCGEIHLCPVGLYDDALEDDASNYSYVKPPFFPKFFPKPTDNKYSRGVVGVVASAIMPGATYLAAAAARRCGIGAVKIFSPPETVRYFQQMLPSCLVISCKSPRELLDGLQQPSVDSIVVGCGLVEIQNNSGLLQEILALDKHTVVDASAIDALHMIRDSLTSRSDGGLVVTPHMEEFSRLFPELRDTHPLEAATIASRKLQAIVLIKGFTTIIAAPNGEVRFQTNASPDLAVAGSGDVQSGIIAALLCKYTNLNVIENAFNATSSGSWWHSEAGEGFGLVAEDIVEGLTGVVDDFMASREVSD